LLNSVTNCDKNTLIVWSADVYHGDTLTYVQVHVHRLVVVDDNNIVQGIVSLSDVLHYLVLAPLGQFYILYTFILFKHFVAYST